MSDAFGRRGGVVQAQAAMRHVKQIALLGLLGMALSGCLGSQTMKGGDPLITGSIGTASSATPSVKETAKLGRKWQADPGNVRLGLAYAERLKKLGQVNDQLNVLKVLVERHPRDNRLRDIYGKALLAAGRPVPAEVQFRTMIRQGRNDWKAYNALGSALADQGRFKEARTAYNEALKRSPGNPKIINNIALSYILEGNPARAEKMLRTALQKVPQEDPAAKKLRQNLALALGLQGRFKEARYVASQDLSPAEVEENMAYLRRMLGATDTWKELQKG